MTKIRTNLNIKSLSGFKRNLLKINNNNSSRKNKEANSSNNHNREGNGNNLKKDNKMVNIKDSNNNLKDLLKIKLKEVLNKDKDNHRA